METIKKIGFAQIACIVLLVMLLMQTCGVKKSLRIVNQKIDSLENVSANMAADIQKLPTKVEIDKTLRKNMYESLVIEEDVDKGVISISEIMKKKIENEEY